MQEKNEKNEKIILFHINPRENLDPDAYQAAFEDMLKLVSAMPGYQGIQSFAGEDGSELAVARFESDDALRAWRELPEHRRMQDRGKTDFFAGYRITVTNLDHEYEWAASDGTTPLR